MSKTVNFCGDSFCESLDENSWTVQLTQQLNYKMIGRGKLGSAHEHAIQSFNPSADLTIFCWTEPHRLYHKTHRLNMSSCDALRDQNPVYEAGYQYYKYIHDAEHMIQRQKRDFYWFDQEVLSLYSGTCIHLWCYQKTYQWRKGETVLQSSLSSYAQRFSGSINHFNEQFNSQLSKRIYQYLRSLNG
jgi:hypothetical protein